MGTRHRAALLVTLLVACNETPSPRSPDRAVPPVDLVAAADRAAGDLPASDRAPADRPGADGPRPDLGPWKLVWSDEFSGAGAPDPSRWGYEVGFVRNNELQYYTKDRRENARVENGNLVIELRRDNFEGHEYTAASLITQGKASWTYGRVEVRAQLPTGLGLWPAIWMLGTNITSVGWPSCGEIDIMENVGFEPNRIYGTVHWNAGGHQSKGASTDLTASPPFKSFHVYAIEWLKGRIDFFVDQTKYFSYPNPGSWPFDKPQYLILNIAWGGSWGGQKGIDPAVLPQKMLIDYVRVYAPTTAP